MKKEYDKRDNCNILLYSKKFNLSFAFQNLIFFFFLGTFITIINLGFCNETQTLE